MHEKFLILLFFCLWRGSLPVKNIVGRYTMCFYRRPVIWDTLEQRIMKYRYYITLLFLSAGCGGLPPKSCILYFCVISVFYFFLLWLLPSSLSKWLQKKLKLSFSTSTHFSWLTNCLSTVVEYHINFYQKT